MKTPDWFIRNRALSHLRIATAVTLIFAAAAMAFFAARPSSVVAQSTDAQAFPKPMPLPPIPPKKGLTALAATAAPAAGSPSQLLTNQPPVLDYVDCGPGNPILLTDGTVMVQDDGCQDWWKLTPDEFGSYVNGTWTRLASTPAGYSHGPVGRFPWCQRSAEADRPQAGGYNIYEIALDRSRQSIWVRAVALVAATAAC